MLTAREERGKKSQRRREKARGANRARETDHPLAVGPWQYKQVHEGNSGRNFPRRAPRISREHATTEFNLGFRGVEFLRTDFVVPWTSIHRRPRARSV